MAKDKKEREMVNLAGEAALVEIGGITLPIGRVVASKLEPGPDLSDLADEAFKTARDSLAKLMPHRYRIEVTDGHGRKAAYGLDRWVKLVDGRDELERQLQGKGRKLPIRKAVA